MASAPIARKTPSRQQVVALDKAHLWHPYTAMQPYIESTDPLVITEASGARLVDADGREYLDGNSSWWVATLGHNHPRLVQALKDQADRFCHVSLAGVTHAPAATLAERLVHVAPKGLTRVFYSDDGSTAIEAAIKICVQYWQQNGAPKKNRFVSLSGAFHGETTGAASLGGVELFRRPFSSILFDVIQVEPPSDQHAFERAFEQVSSRIREDSSDLAAIVVEPLVQGSDGMRMYPPQYLAEIRKLCDQYDVLLLVDEVFTGYGRTGTFWACEQAKITPDLMCLAKGFTGGVLPMAATLVTERLFNGFLGSKDRMLCYGHSFCGNPLGCAVALEVLSIFEEEKIVESITPRAELLAATVKKLSELPGVKQPRHLGMIAAVDLDKGAQGYLGQVGWQVYEEAKQHGAYIRPLGSVSYLAPPVNIALDELEKLVSIWQNSIETVLRRQ